VNVERALDARVDVAQKGDEILRPMLRLAAGDRKHEHDSTEVVIRESPKRATRQKKAS